MSQFEFCSSKSSMMRMGSPQFMSLSVRPAAIAGLILSDKCCLIQL